MLPARRLGGEVAREDSLALWAATVTSEDAVRFLMVSRWPFSLPSLAPGENPRFLDRVATALLCRSLLEDAALELSTGGSPSGVWWSCGASVSNLRCAFFGKACLELFILGACL